MNNPPLSTLLLTWCTEAYVSTAINDGTCTLPGAHTRPKSLRTRSTIIKFSALLFSSVRSACAMEASRAGS